MRSTRNLGPCKQNKKAHRCLNPDHQLAPNHVDSHFLMDYNFLPFTTLRSLAEEFGLLESSLRIHHGILYPNCMMEAAELLRFVGCLVENMQNTTLKGTAARYVQAACKRMDAGDLFL
jgi:hypothetical protein